MQLSVIIVTYNNEKYIGEALTSLTEQGFNKGEQEVIVVNDGSTDNTEKVIDEFCAKYDYVKKINKVNGGVSSARNIGLNEAKGDYVTFVDGDDVIAKNIYSNVLDFCYTQDLDGFYFEATKDQDNLLKELKKEQLEKEVQISRFKLTYEIWRVIFKRKIIEENGLSFDESLVIGEDSLFSNSFSKLTKKVGYINAPLYFYRTNEKSLTNSDFSLRKSLCRLRVFKVTLESLKTHFDNVYFPGCMPCYLSYGVQNILWDQMKNKVKAKETIKLLKENGITLKDIKHKTDSKHAKLKYAFRFKLIYKLSCLAYKIFR